MIKGNEEFTKIKGVSVQKKEKNKLINNKGIKIKLSTRYKGIIICVSRK